MRYGAKDDGICEDETIVILSRSLTRPGTDDYWVLAVGIIRPDNGTYNLWNEEVILHVPVSDIDEGTDNCKNHKNELTHFASSLSHHIIFIIVHS